MEAQQDFKELLELFNEHKVDYVIMAISPCTILELREEIFTCCLKEKNDVGSSHKLYNQRHDRAFVC